MNRLLSPNEAKFWLLDLVAPMNSVVVVRRATAPVWSGQPRHFAVPMVHTDNRQRPRWGEPDRDGVLERQHTDDIAWLETARRLLDVRVGTAGSPPWHAVIQTHPGGTTLVLAVNHALTDWRTSLHVGRALLADEHPGPLAPPCEEMLPATVFSASDADSLLDSWWSARAGARWQALGQDGLTAILPPQTQTRFQWHRLSLADTERLQARCEAEGASLNGALAIALRETMHIDAVAHSVDMERFIRPAPPAGPGLAVAHVFTRLADGPFWEAARDNRAELFGQIRDGAVGDILLQLPRLLMGGTPTYQPAVMTITGGPTVGTRKAAEPDTTMELVLSSARGGGGIVILSHCDGCLQLIAGTPTGQPDVPLTAVADCLLAACA